MRWMRGFIGFIVGFTLATVCEYVVMSALAGDTPGPVAPPTAFFIAPFIVGAVGAWIAQRVNLPKTTRPRVSSRAARLVAASLASWWLGVIAYLWIVQPYGSFAPIGHAFDDLRLASTLRWLPGPA